MSKEVSFFGSSKKESRSSTKDLVKGAIALAIVTPLVIGASSFFGSHD